MWSPAEIVGFLIAAVVIALGADAWWLARERGRRQEKR